MGRNFALHSHVISLCRDYVFDDEIFEIAQFSIEHPLGSVVLIEGRESMQVIFTGLYHDVRFEFNIYVNAKGCLNLKTRQNPVWHKPVVLPDVLDVLRDAVDKVVQWVKSVDLARDATGPQEAA
jgi:hypothetical protein